MSLLTNQNQQNILFTTPAVVNTGNKPKMGSFGTSISQCLY